MIAEILPAFSLETLVALITLIALEVILGIDNIVFIAIVSDRLPQKEASRARKAGLGLAVLTRILMVSLIAVIVKLERPLLELFGFVLTGKGLILVAGGLYLLVRSTLEIYRKVEGLEIEETGTSKAGLSFWSVVLNIVFIDLIFSVESIITAVGLVGNVVVIIVAVLVSVAVMIAFVDAVSEFVKKHASIKILALSFLVLIGVLLLAEGTGFHFPRGYVYFAMAFSFVVQMLNIRYEDKKLRKVAGASE